MTAKNAEKAAWARLKDDCALSTMIDLYLTEIKTGAKDVQERMPKIRVLHGLLGQAIHEFNAYNNVATT